MKKIYLVAFAILFAGLAHAQVSVTFRVDMTGETVSPNGVHVAGDWQANAGYPEDWNPGSAAMSDDDSDGIYELTVELSPGQYQYKYVNGSEWGNDETPPSEVTFGGNRFFAITEHHATDGFELPVVVFNAAAPEGKVGVRLMIDMSNTEISDNGVHVAGDLIDPNWAPAYGTTFDVGNSQFAYVAYVDGNASYLYKFINGSSWVDPDTPESVPDACGEGTNRVVEVGTEEVVTTAFCFGTCETCQEPNVTFTVDLSGVDVDNGGYIAGEFNGWSGEPMVDNGDGTYSIQKFLSPGTYPFKFQNGSGGWENVPSFCASDGNRVITIPEGDEPVAFAACFNQCTETCIPDPDPANVTFRVDMSDMTVAPEGVFVMGGFTEPAWQSGALEMSDGDGDGIYQVTVLISGPAYFEYKFVNGDVNDPTNEEFDGNEEQLECNVPSGVGGWNRTHTRTGEDEVLDAVPFGLCGIVGLEEASVGSVFMYPNPATDHFTLSVENPAGKTIYWSIIDITGKVVRQETPLHPAGKTVVHTHDLNSGLYFLNITNASGESSVHKLMVN